VKRVTVLFIALMLLPCVVFADNLTTNGSFEIDLNTLPFRTENIWRLS